MSFRVAYAVACAGLVLFTGALIVLAEGDPLVFAACAFLGAATGWVLANLEGDNDG